MNLIHKRIDNIPTSNKVILRSIYELALEKSYESRVDEKNKNKWAREISDIDIYTALNICLKTSTHWTIIYRDMSFINEKSFWEFGASTLNLDSDIFIWTKLTDTDSEIIFNEYNLNVDNYGTK